METRLELATDLRAYLEGPWEITRSIDDRRNDVPGLPLGCFIGQAVFIPEGAGLDYRERGRLKTADFDDQVHQGYTYQFPAPHRAAVSFTDGRAFHDLDLSTGLWRTSHHCDPDIYDGEFALDSKDVWRSQWNIHGPRKDMTIQTTYTRTRSTDTNS